MDGSRLYSGHFKHYAFVWRPAFTLRQASVYPSENKPLVQRQNLYPTGTTPPLPAAAPLISTQEIVDSFVNSGCTDDEDRYLSRKLRMGRFLEAADTDTLRGDLEETVSRPKALIDDRNNESVTRVHLAGNCRQPLGPLSARRLFRELSKAVGNRVSEQAENLNLSLAIVTSFGRGSGPSTFHTGRASSSVINISPGFTSQFPNPFNLRLV